MPRLRFITVGFVGSCIGMAVAVLPAAPAVAAPVTCGSSITTSTTLRADLICGPGVALELGGQNVVLDLGGHTIFGTGTGIHSTFGQNATIQNGTIRGFVAGVVLDRTVGVLIERVRFVDNRTAVSLSRTVDTVVQSNRIVGSTSTGISVFMSNRGRVVDNVLRRNGVGVSLSVTSNNLVSGNRVINSHGDGISLANSVIDAIVRGNTANRNGGDGIHVASTSTTITRNTANRNGALGIGAVTGVLDGGGNTARRNGNPAQCTGVVCTASNAD